MIKCDPACANPNINYTIEGSDITLVEHAIHDAEVADGTGTKLCSGDNSTPMSCPAITATTISAVLEVKTGKSKHMLLHFGEALKIFNDPFPGPSTASSSNLIKLEVIEADGMTVRSEMVTTAP